MSAIRDPSRQPIGRVPPTRWTRAETAGGMAKAAVPGNGYALKHPAHVADVIKLHNSRHGKFTMAQILRHGEPRRSTFVDCAPQQSRERSNGRAANEKGVGASANPLVRTSRRRRLSGRTRTVRRLHEQPDD